MVTEGQKNLASSSLQMRSSSPENRTQLHLRLHYAIAQILADARTENEACTGILSTLCDNLGWPWGALWLRRGEELRLLGCWHNSKCAAEEFNQISRACAFRKGEGLPGKVWAESEPVWIGDFTADTHMPRRLVAERCNFRSAFAIPVSGQDFLGVIEFFTEQNLPADPELLKMAGATGAQIGQFLDRKRAERALAESKGLFQGVFQGARDSILLTDENG